MPTMTSHRFEDDNIARESLEEVSGSFEEPVTIKRYVSTTAGDDSGGVASTQVFASIPYKANITDLTAREINYPNSIYAIGDLSAEFRIEVFGEESAQTSSSTNIFDSFNRADSLTGLGTSTSGQAWTSLAGIMGIKDNQAVIVTPSGGNQDGSVISSGVSDCEVGCTFNYDPDNPNPDMRLLFRMVNSNVGYVVDTGGSDYQVYLISSGIYILIIQTDENVHTGDQVKVVLSGAKISLVVNGIIIGQTTESGYQTATKHGIGYASGVGPLDSASWSDFFIRSSSTGSRVSDRVVYRGREYKFVGHIFRIYQNSIWYWKGVLRQVKP